MDICAIGYYRVTHKGEFSRIDLENSTPNDISYGSENIRESVSFMDGSDLLELIKKHLEDVFDITIKDNEIKFEYFNGANGTGSTDIYVIKQVPKKENK